MAQMLTIPAVNIQSTIPNDRMYGRRFKVCAYTQGCAASPSCDGGFSEFDAPRSLSFLWVEAEARSIESLVDAGTQTSGAEIICNTKHMAGISKLTASGAGCKRGQYLIRYQTYLSTSFWKTRIACLFFHQTVLA